MDVESEPGILNMLLEDGRTVRIMEVEEKLIDPPLKMKITFTENIVSKIQIINLKNLFKVVHCSNCLNLICFIVLKCLYF